MFLVDNCAFVLLLRQLLLRILTFFILIRIPGNGTNNYGSVNSNFHNRTITTTNAHIKTNNEILAGDPNPQSFLSLITASAVLFVGTPIDTVYRLYTTTAYICLINSFNTNATTSCMSVPAQLRLLAALLLPFQTF